MKTKTVFVCTECGNEFPKWMGKCTACNSWNTLVEETVITKQPGKSSRSGMKSDAISALENAGDSAVPERLKNISTTDEIRTGTGLSEFDRVLGGGLVAGSLVLLGGDPGIGKSTILLQICQHIGKTQKILYVSGEESLRQIKLRADRLGVDSDNIKIFSETNTENILECISREKPDILIVDSVQTMFNPNVNSAPGSVSQIRDVASMLMRIAKTYSIATFLVGHVTKEGSIAGPKVLEHIVDCVLYFEGDQNRSYRIIRAIKNRFGSTNEIGVFEMNSSGLSEIKNPSSAMLSGRPQGVPGSCIVCTMEGTRPVLAEIQALATPTAFGNPRRMTTGVDFNRAMMLLAILEKRSGLHLSSYDTYINVVGGLRMVEPAADLGIIIALASGFKNKPVPEEIAAVGEVGLTGEIRSCSFLESRIIEAEKMGFKKIIVPYMGAKDRKKFKNIEICQYSNITQVMKDIF